MYDFIGDIHGYGDELEALLIKMGYERDLEGIFRHPTRKAFFLGDFIDRGPKIKKTLEIVKSMVDGGSAKAVMANHEFNLICFLTEDQTGSPIRPRTIGNIQQVAETLAQLSKKELEDYSKWFMTLPLWHEEEEFRVAHACWSQPDIDFLESVLGGNLLNLDVVKRRFVKSDPFYKSIEIVLKGPEVDLNGHTFVDKGGKVRSKGRVAWWCEQTLLADHRLKKAVGRADIDYTFYGKEEKPVFFGHYWMDPKEGVFVTAPNAQCLDFSVANKGFLAAYRWDGEREIDLKKFVTN